MKRLLELDVDSIGAGGPLGMGLATTTCSTVI
jgi:hypothetical protein